MPLGFLSLHAPSQWLNARLVAATHRNLLENTIVTSPIMLTRCLHGQSSARLVGGQGGLGEFENTGVLSQPMKQPPSLGAKSRIGPL
jgi:hypothetical protein